MNDRIKELAEQALRYSMMHDGVYRPEGYANGVSKDFADKFAELIIRECTDVLAAEMNRLDGLGRVVASQTMDTAQVLIKQYFGVEECKKKPLNLS